MNAHVNTSSATPHKLRPMGQDQYEKGCRERVMAGKLKNERRTIVVDRDTTDNLHEDD